MQLGLVGLGKMSANMSDRLRVAGVEVLGYARGAGPRDVPALRQQLGGHARQQASHDSAG